MAVEYKLLLLKLDFTLFCILWD